MAAVASGVTSSGETPVPPVVTMTSTRTARAASSASDTAGPSATTTGAYTSNDRDRNHSTMTGPVRSV